MKANNIMDITDLRLSIELKTMGLEQEGEYYWLKTPIGWRLIDHKPVTTKSFWQYCRAFTGTELANIFNHVAGICNADTQPVLIYHNGEWQAYIKNPVTFENPKVIEKTIGNALARLLILLQSHGVIKIHDGKAIKV